MTGIYQIRNIISGSIYIGSAKSLKDRKNLHFSLLRRNKHHSDILQKAFNKYGIQKFLFEILEKCETDQLIIREQFYINKLIPKYNICKIAGSSVGTISKLRKPIDQYNLNGKFIKTWNSLLEIKESFGLTNSSKISKVCKKERNKAYGFVWRYSGDLYSYNSKRKGKGIAMINEEGIILKSWERIKDCAQDLNTTSVVLCKILSDKNRQKTLNGKIFKRI